MKLTKAQQQALKRVWLRGSDQTFLQFLAALRWDLVASWCIGATCGSASNQMGIHILKKQYEIQTNCNLYRRGNPVYTGRILAGGEQR